ncbi:MAG: methyltransferase [bacterium]|nr:methyltransferase [bacterium]
MFLAILIIGFTSMVSQVILLRELMAAVGGNELLIGLTLASWLFWAGLGSSLPGRLVDKLSRPHLVLGLAQIITSFALPAVIILVRARLLFPDLLPGEMVGPVPILLLSLLSPAPLASLLGVQFILACRIKTSPFRISDFGFRIFHSAFCNPQSRVPTKWVCNLQSEQSAIPHPQSEISHPKSEISRVTSVYIIEALGASGGGLIFSLLIPMMLPLKIIICLSLLNLISSCFLQIKTMRRFSLKLGVFALGGITLIGLWMGTERMETISQSLRWQNLKLVKTQDSIYGRVSITRLGDEFSFYENGGLMFTTRDRIGSEELVHLALLQHPDPQKILLIGRGAGGTLLEILKYPVKEIDYLELDPLVIELSRRILPPEDLNALEDERVRVRHVDGRSFIKQTKQTFYDVILVNLPDPSTAQINRFYSREFFSEAKQILSPDGLIAFGLTSSENYINPELQRLLSCIFNTLRSFFDRVIVVPGETNYFLAGGEAADLTLNSQELIKRLKERKIETIYVSEAYLPARLTPDRVAYLQRTLIEGGAGRINSDFTPIGYLYYLLVWGAHFPSSVQPLITTFSGMGPEVPFLAVLFFLIIMLPLALRFRRKLPVITAVMTTGFAEITFQIIIILAHQAIYGYVYYRLGLIMAMFMVGLVLGGWWIRRQMSEDRRQESGVRSQRSNQSAIRNPQSAIERLTRIQLVVVIYSFLLPFVLMGLAKSGGGEFIFILLPLVAGIMGGLQFPLACEACWEEGRTGKITGLIYGADLFGACLGASLISLALIPLLGLIWTSFFTAAVNLVSLILLWITQK